MAEYYAVERSPEYLMHYGVKGMKWGVRKALEKGNMSKLAYHYQRAMNKRSKLKERTNKKEQKEDAKAYLGGAGLLLGTGALAGAAGYGIAKGQVAAQKALMPNSRSYMILHPVGLYGTAGLAGLGGIASLGASGAAAYRATKRGNKKAIEKYKRFNKEMNKTFNKSVRNKVKDYLVKHPEERFDYDPISNTIVSEKYATPAQKKALERAYGKPTLSKSDSRAFSAIASNPEKYRVKKRRP